MLHECKNNVARYFGAMKITPKTNKTIIITWRKKKYFIQISSTN